MGLRTVPCLAGSVEDEKLQWGSPLTVLGIRLKHTAGAIAAHVEESKADKWCSELYANICSKKMTSKEAEKAAGRPAFAAK